MSFGVDSVGVLRLIDEVFGEAKEVAELLVEIEVGENRSGVIEESDFRALMSTFLECKNAKFCGVFSHDGHSYKAKDKRECEQIFKVATERTLKFAGIAREFGYENFTVSIGSTPSLINDFEIPKGVTEHEVWIDSLFDEHAIILNEKFAKSVRVGDLVRIYPNHICPVVNLYDYAYLVSGDEVCEKVPVLARGKIE